MKRVVPIVTEGGQASAWRSVLDEYEQAVTARTRPSVLASRKACLDAHNWKSINSASPLLTKRTPFIRYLEGA